MTTEHDNAVHGGKPEPDYTGFRIKSIWAFVVVGDDDEEGVPAFPLDGVQWPMVCADERRVEDLRLIAEVIARVEGLKITLARFDVRTDVETFGG